MFLKKDKRANGKTYLTIIKGYRDPVTKKSRNKSVMKVGYLEDLLDQYEDPIAHFEEVAARLTEEERLANLPLSFTFDSKEVIKSNVVNRKNLGYVVLSHFYHNLKIHEFWNNRQKTSGTDFLLNHVFQLLVFTRSLYPSSKKASFDYINSFFTKFDFSLHDVYRALSKFYPYKDDLILWIHQNIIQYYGRDLSKVYYDVTNYYFEIPYEDDFRKRGVSKEHRPNPIIQMGLLMDNSGIPISYELFEGNTNDSITLMPSLNKLKKHFNLGKVIVVADKAMNSGENMAYNIIKGNGYIFSGSVRGASRELKDFVLDQTGYSDNSDEFKIKSRIVPQDIWVTDIHNKRKKVPIDQKQVVFYSEKYAKKSRMDRERTILKTLKLIEKGIDRPNSSAYKYIKKEFIDLETGEILKTKKNDFLDIQKIKEEEKYDGYYIINTSELDMKDMDIVQAYHGLWKIEESFKITKSQLEARPVYLSRKDRIESHFLICFVTLVLLRLLEKDLDGSNISIEKAIEEMREITGTHLDENYYMFDCFNEIIEKLGQTVGVDFSKRFITVAEIDSLISGVKKGL
ncbi:IS1634 family transposase [Microaceticoccus formicicus]|uniref:IS1634 family transposase n=1 Tax=Microaceticoccus formicicus TaxID=3118105 RepID=UPI003CD02D2C|nr:IS1634 family transposase [Peptoniphilaceae bacterium AMB_02]WVH64377.1 IS1634 family transposase [Peptoniphilaceae bacterium AMB_02]